MLRDDGVSTIDNVEQLTFLLAQGPRTPTPEVIAQETVEDLEMALREFAAITEAPGARKSDATKCAVHER
ncbi:hypothetical protein [Micromonospora endolithica]|uniref:Uncharacterized protein n=1 Tax=Micromonospora endolithica TaxID=230091 RepID=A0A3A9ZR94_9ACTN|nr:hypothetical protein [Micromonospora endolithica]RKN50729.1 hypothetical protein D7223_02915 [Micromonospora endolithica]TWJ20529.1 hypothetical protein JD76_00627 [Micromonospora endolithica]